MKITNPDKIWFPKPIITKQQIIHYYDQISPFFLKYVKNHLIVMHRFPNGIDHESFYQKQIPDYFPASVKRKTIMLKKKEKQTLVLVSSKKSLQYLVNQGTIIFHSWLSKATQPNKPDKIIFDFDPTNKDMKSLRFAVFAMKKLLQKYQLESFVMTTGSHGFHVVVPIKPKHNFEATHVFAKKIAQELVDLHPTMLTINPIIKKRKGKIFIDYLRNSYGQTSVAAYSVRAHPKAPVATPITWSALNRTVPQQFTIFNIFTKLKKSGDAWKDFEKKRNNLHL